MNIQQIQHVVNLVAQSQLHEVEIKDADGHIRVKNRLTPQGQSSANGSLAMMDIPSLPQDSDIPANDAVTMHTVTSQLIGRIQLSADIASEPLVSQGDKVAVGDTLAYVASLGKLLPVVSNQAGIVHNILVNNDDKVEYGSPLFELTVG